MTKPGWQQQLERDGFVVVPGVIPRAACDDFVEAGWSWLEKFPHGFKRADRSTWDGEHLPYGVKGGLYNRYSVNHEAFVWKMRTQAGIVDTFAQLWGTDDLVASFDGINITLPINAETGRTDMEAPSPWPHIDQNPRTADRLELYQGIANLTPCGPRDGGLCLLKGSHLLHPEHFDTIGGFRQEQDSGLDQNGYDFSAEDAAWYRARGCDEVKICAAAGDLIIWDSRTMHWNAAPRGEQTRFVAYVCYCPRSWLSAAELERKLEVFRKRKGTTHWPNQNVVPADRADYYGAVPRRPDGTVDPANRSRPFDEPDETDLVMRLVGLRA